MSEDRDPPRLLATRAEELRELLPGLERAREQGPNPEQLARICAGTAARVAADGEAGGNPPSADPASPDPAGSAGGGAAFAGTAGKLLKLLVIAAALGGGAFVALRGAQPGAPAEGPSSSRPAAPAVVAPVPEPPPRAPAVAAETAVPGASAEAERVAPQRPEAASGGSRRAARPQPAREPGAADAELALLKRARAEVRAHPARALALTDEHAARFPRAKLAEEREVIAIEALLVQGQRAAAQARARAFFAQYPGSAHVRRVRALLAEHAAALSDEIPAVDSHRFR